MPGNENPTTKFKVDISELKAGIQESNRLIRMANSEFKAAASGMDDWADSTDGVEEKIKQLNAVHDAEKEKLKLLQKQYKLTVDAQGENSRGAEELAIKINNQQAAVNKVAKELSDYDDRLEMVKKAQDNAKKSGKSFEDELRKLEKAADEAGDEGFTILKGVLSDLVSNGIQKAVSAAGDLVGALLDLPEATKEFRTVFGAAMQSAEDSAVGVNGARKAFEEFYKVAADEGQAAEATSHLVNLAKNEEELQHAIDGVIGAWVEYGDSISIEGLSEAADETYKTGTLTGQMADAINWAGESEEKFQEQLDSCSNTQERQQLVLDTLNRLYGENAKKYAESNDGVLSANEASLKMLQTQSEIANIIEPLTVAWVNLKSNAMEALIPVVTEGVESLADMANYLKEHQALAQILTSVVITLATGFGVLAGAMAIANVISAVQKAMALLNTTMLANPFVLIVALIAGLVAAFIYLRQNGEEVKAFFAKMWTTMKDAAGDAIDEIIGFLKKLPVRAAQWFISTIQKAIEFRNDLIKTGAEAANGLANSIVNKIKLLPGQIKLVGSNIVRGLWSGIDDMTGWISEKIRGFATNALDEIKDFFGIHSPSKVMKEEVGKNLVRGLGAGIEENSSYAKKIINKFGEDLLSTLEKRLSNYKIYNSMTLNEEVNYWKNARKLFEKGTQDRIDADAKYYEAKKSLNEKLKTAEKTYTESVAAAYENMATSIDSAMKEYEDSINSRADTISSSINLFSAFEKETEVTGQSLMYNLQSQVGGLKNWLADLTSLESRGLDDGLLKELREMGVSAAGQIEALNSLSDDELEKYVELWKSKNDLARQAAEKELAPLQEEIAAKIAALTAETKESIKGYRKAYDDALAELGVAVKGHVESADKTLVETAAITIVSHAPSIGENTINGIIDGLNNRAGALYQTISGIIGETISQAAAAADIHSPSEIMRKFIGQNLIKGAEIGVIDEARGLYKSMKTAISGSISNVKGGLKNTSGFGSAGGNVVNNYTFNQTNNSPKTLSRIEIYRQTKNQIRQLQGV